MADAAVPRRAEPAPLSGLLETGTVVKITARVHSHFINEGEISVCVRIDNPHHLGFQQVCVPIEAIEIPRETPRLDGGDLDRLTAKLVAKVP